MKVRDFSLIIRDDVIMLVSLCSLRSNVLPHKMSYHLRLRYRPIHNKLLHQHPPIHRLALK